MQLEVLMNTITALKLAREALHIILGAVDTAVSKLRTQCLPLSLHVGIQSVPVEILSQIFQAANDLEDNHWAKERPMPFIKTVTHVCRRFRIVALDTPALWTNLNEYYSLDQRNAFIDRAGSAGLRLYTDESYTPFIKDLLPLASRWEVLDLNLRGGFPEYVNAINSTQTFSSLKELFISCWQPDPLPPNQPPADIRPTMLHKWGFPALRHFTGLNCVPLHAWCESLRTCDVTIHPRYHAEDFIHLFAFLRSTASLEDLTITFAGRVDGIVLVGDERTAHRRIALPYLNVLHLRFRDVKDQTCLMVFFQTLETPALSNLRLHIHASKDFSEVWAPKPLPERRLSPKSAELFVRGCHSTGESEMVIHCIMTHLLGIERLQNLTINCSPLRLEKLPIVQQLRNFLYFLHTLRFVHCHELRAPAVLNALGGGLKKKVPSGWKNLVEFEVRHCQDFYDYQGEWERADDGHRQIVALLGDKFIYTT